jgi:hypothetical protein
MTGWTLGSRLSLMTTDLPKAGEISESVLNKFDRHVQQLWSPEWQIPSADLSTQFLPQFRNWPKNPLLRLTLKLTIIHSIYKRPETSGFNRVCCTPAATLQPRGPVTPKRLAWNLFKQWKTVYSGRKITASLGNVTVRGEIRWKGQGGSKTAKCLGMYSKR